MKIGTILTADTVIQDGRRPNGNLWLYSDAVHGNESFAAAARDILAGKIVSFAACDREGPDAPPPKVKEIVTVGMGDGGDPEEGHSDREPRFVGERNDPNGGGSHALIASWYGRQCTSETHIAVALALRLASISRHHFRLPNLPDAPRH